MGDPILCSANLRVPVSGADGADRLGMALWVGLTLAQLRKQCLQWFVGYLDGVNIA